MDGAVPGGEPGGDRGRGRGPARSVPARLNGGTTSGISAGGAGSGGGHRSAGRGGPRAPRRGPGTSALLEALDPSVRTRDLSYAVWEVGANVLLATGSAPPSVDQARRVGTSRPRAVGRLAAEHARPCDPVWFRNSLRGAAALAVAVSWPNRRACSGRSGCPRTLSVLRSNALARPRPSSARRWYGRRHRHRRPASSWPSAPTRPRVAALPFACCSPPRARAISFAAGQAGFNRRPRHPVQHHPTTG